MKNPIAHSFLNPRLVGLPQALNAVKRCAHQALDRDPGKAKKSPLWFFKKFLVAYHEMRLNGLCWLLGIPTKPSAKPPDATTAVKTAPLHERHPTPAP